MMKPRSVNTMTAFLNRIKTESQVKIISDRD